MYAGSVSWSRRFRVRGERVRWAVAGAGLDEEEGWAMSTSESESESTSMVEGPALVLAALALGGSSAPGGRLSKTAASKFKYSVLSAPLNLAKAPTGKKV